MTFFTELEQIILKFTLNCKRPELSEKKSKAGGIMLPDFRVYCKAVVIKIIWHWHKSRHVHHWNQTAQNITIIIWSNNLQQRS